MKHPSKKEPSVTGVGVRVFPKRFFALLSALGSTTFLLNLKEGIYHPTNPQLMGAIIIIIAFSLNIQVVRGEEAVDYLNEMGDYDLFDTTDTSNWDKDDLHG
jgi:hypothetical protein